MHSAQISLQQQRTLYLFDAVPLGFRCSPRANLAMLVWLFGADRWRRSVLLGIRDVISRSVNPQL